MKAEEPEIALFQFNAKMNRAVCLTCLVLRTSMLINEHAMLLPKRVDNNRHHTTVAGVRSHGSESGDVRCGEENANVGMRVNPAQHANLWDVFCTTFIHAIGE